MRVSTVGLGVALAFVLAGPVSAGGKEHETWNQVWTSDSSFRDFAYALVEPTPKGWSLMMTGQEGDHSEVLKLSKHVTGPFVWIRSGKERFMIRDEAAIKQAKEILEPELSLNQKQSELGDLQAEIGDLQARIGDEQARLGDEQARLGDRQAALADKAIDASAGGSKQQAYQREQESLAQDQEELGRAQGRLGGKQSKVGRDQSKLGEEQAKFGAHQKDVQASVRAKMKTFLADARNKGLAVKA